MNPARRNTRFSFGLCGLLLLSALIFCAGLDTGGEFPATKRQALSELQKTRIEFARNLFAAQSHLALETEPVLISPAGLEMALSILAAGAVGETRKQLTCLLPLHMAESRKLQQEFRDSGGTIDCETIMEYDDSITTLRESFLDRIRKDDFCRIIPGKFHAKKSASRWTVFKFVTRLRFNGEWASPFNPDQVEIPFYRTVKTPPEKCMMMEMNPVMLNYFDDGNWKSVLLPFRNRDYSLLLLKPAQITPLKELILHLSLEVIISHLEHGESTWLTIRMPEFRQAGLMNLKDSLNELGVDLSEVADFAEMHHIIPSGMPFHPLFRATIRMGIADFIQENEFEASENYARGKSTTRFTGFGLGCSVLPEKIEPLEFTVDRPFLYLLLHNPSKAVLFMGSHTSR